MSKTIIKLKHKCKKCAFCWLLLHKCAHVIILISQNLFYKFRPMKFHHQEVSCRIRHYGVILCSSVCGVMVNYQCEL